MQLQQLPGPQSLASQHPPAAIRVLPAQHFGVAPLQQRSFPCPSWQHPRRNSLPRHSRRSHLGRNTPVLRCRRSAAMGSKAPRHSRDHCNMRCRNIRNGRDPVALRACRFSKRDRTGSAPRPGSYMLCPSRFGCRDMWAEWLWEQGAVRSKPPSRTAHHPLPLRRQGQGGPSAPTNGWRRPPTI
jgi:hypothetical protein